MDTLFSQQSLYWRVNREWLIALAGPRAVLMELAHPLVAAGVEQHSAYRTDPFTILLASIHLRGVLA